MKIVVGLDHAQPAMPSGGQDTVTPGEPLEGFQQRASTTTRFGVRLELLELARGRRR